MKALNGLKYDTSTGTGKNKAEYINLECAFDIETTSTHTESGNKAGFMYAWVFGIKDENYLFHGRTWSEFKKLIVKLKEHFNLSKDRVLVCYIHNLGFEFQFMRKHFNWEKVFSLEQRRPLKALTTDGIEFRDSLALSGSSLSNVAKNLVKHDIEKKVGDLDYTLIRHHNTPLTKSEWSYIENDVLILLYYINEQLEMYDNHIPRIPLTNTSRVRKYVRHNCYYTSKTHRKSDKNKYYKYRKLMNSLQLTPESYMSCRNAFMGGFVHANASKTGDIIEDVTSIDFASSYPAVMVSEKFPMSKPIKVSPKDINFRKLVRSHNHNLIFTARFKDITSTFSPDNYISESNCHRVRKPIRNNGRIFSADELIITLTDVDFNVIDNTYSWKRMDITDVYMFHSAYLPKPIIESIMELYESKTELKGVEGRELDYALSKSMLNSIYGMTVTDIVKDNAIYRKGWGKQEAVISEEIEKYNNSKSRFLYYPWGVFVTAYARRNLWYGITNIGDDYIYSDTDSIKFVNYDKHKSFIKKYNERITKKVQAVCNYYKLDYNRLAPKTKEGVTKPIGIWEVDGKYSRFKTLGSKRYIFEDKNTQELEITVSGLGKDEGLHYLRQQYKTNTNILENFDDNLYVPPEHTGKMVHTYIDNPLDMTITDYLNNDEVVFTQSGVYLESEPFNLSLTDEYMEFMRNLKNGYLYVGQGRV